MLVRKKYEENQCFLLKTGSFNTPSTYVAIAPSISQVRSQFL
ncbi:hypothetical protein [Calothrix sp. NIES-2100]